MYAKTVAENARDEALAANAAAQRWNEQQASLIYFQPDTPTLTPQP